MEPNFIEEVAKALDVLSVERLVRTSPLGSVRCKKCNKILYTATQARYIIIKVFFIENQVFDLYLCPEQEGENYHVTSLDKRVKVLKNTWLQKDLRREIEQKKARLDGLRVRTDDLLADHQDAPGGENLVVLYGRVRPVVPYTKALRRKIIRALVIPVQGLRKPRAHRFRRKRKPFRPIPRRDTARGDLPRGETVTKMLSWANSHKFHVDNEHRSCRPRGGGAEFRRRNRAREAEAVRRDLEQELGALEPLQGPEEWHQHRCSTNMAALGTVDFDGCYTSPTEIE